MVNNQAQPESKFKIWLSKEGNAYGFIFGYALMFIVFIVVPVLIAALLSFTSFDTIQFPKFIGLKNYVTLLTQDDIFMKYVLPNTIEFAVIVGPGGYALAFMLAWVLARCPRSPTLRSDGLLIPPIPPSHDLRRSHGSGVARSFQR